MRTTGIIHRSAAGWSAVLALLSGVPSTSCRCPDGHVMWFCARAAAAEDSAPVHAEPPHHRHDCCRHACRERNHIAGEASQPRNCCQEGVCGEPAPEEADGQCSPILRSVAMGAPAAALPDEQDSAVPLELVAAPSVVDGPAPGARRARADSFPPADLLSRHRVLRI